MGTAHGVFTPTAGFAGAEGLSGRDVAGARVQGIQISPPIRFSLERAIEYIAPDELVEATPKSIRLRKRTVDHQQRMREVKKMKDLAENT